MTSVNMNSTHWPSSAPFGAGVAMGNIGYMGQIVSLLRDQYNSIRSKGFPAKELHGKQTFAEQKAVYNKLKS